MEISIKKKNGVVEVSARFDPRVGHQRRVRYYCQDAIEYAMKHYPNMDLSPNEFSSCLTISNYKEPLSGTWEFYEDEEQTFFKDMADKFEENQLKTDENSVKISKKQNLKKDKENEIINDD